MNEEEMAAAPSPIIHIPMVMGAVVVSYNLPGLQAPLKLSQAALSDIFLGKITKWNDPKITSANPGLKLPDQPIIVMHRSDGSGTSFIFTSYLAAISPEWKATVGAGKSVKWPVGLGGKGNEGVSGLVKQTEGSIGYVELAYAITNKLPYATLENKSGNYIVPTLESTSLAAQGVTMPDDFRVIIVNSSNPDAYPIAGFTWLLVYKHMDDPAKGKAIVDFIRWAIHDGQKYTKELLYAPLPPSVVRKIDAKLNEITY
jgi:phosphate transport system substrate-binding protein